MKWKNKGNEKNFYSEEYMERWDNGAKLYVFGAGAIGHRLASILIRFNLFRAYVDNDFNKQNSYEGEYRIISLDEYLKKLDGCIIVSVGKKYRNEIIEQLERNGLAQNIDFYEYDCFMNNILKEVLFYYRGMVYVELAQISVTERCTLRCKKCAHGCYAVPGNKDDMPIETVYESADMFFSIVDYIEEFVLIGGETFLYKEIDKAIEYIGERYREKIGIFSITTNGTIIPNENVLKMCCKYDMTIRISNYQAEIPHMAEKYIKLQARLGEYKITNYLGSIEHTWKDYGFDYVDRKEDERGLIKVFDECNTPCREVRGYKYYFCVMARSVSENLGFNVGNEDYLDLREIKDNRKVFVEFNEGYSEKGYLDMCNYCYGAEAANHLIPVAEQLNKHV